MERAIYKPLPMTRISPSVTVEWPGAYAPKPVRADSPAIEVMTDFRQVAAATTRATASIAQATQAMIARGVRLLIVADADRRVEGLITAHDTMGEKAINVLRGRGLVHSELTVADLMVPRSAIDVLDIAAVLRSEVGHIIATLKEAGRQHALVIDRDQLTREEIVRGVFSATQIARQLGVASLSFEVAQTFAEIEAELGN
jgi:predicted transcriptional regulator